MTLSHLRRLSRPTSPSCRGGASSLLRLAQPAVRNTDFGSWVQRAAVALEPVSPWPLGDARPSIITPLAPSRQLSAR